MGDEVRIRLYCQGIGDCILLDLPREDGGRFHLLVDCGIHSLTENGSARMDSVVRDIHARTRGRLDVIAGTHEHWDHLSAFLSAEDRWQRDFEIGQVWLSWAEDPDDEAAKRLDRFKADASAAITGLRSALGVVGKDGVTEAAAFGVHERAAAAVDSLQGFVFGAKGERVRAAREALRALAPTADPLEPGTAAPLPGVRGVTAWVLGPPRDEKKLKKHDNVGDEYRLSMGPGRGFAAVDGAIRVREGTLTVSDDPSSPFDGSQGQSFSAVMQEDEKGRFPAWEALDAVTRQHLWDCYFAGSDDKESLAARRRIDSAWTGAAVNFALQLDRNTNNSSLVLALELGAGGDVLLLAADAQGGAWESFKTLKLGHEGREVMATDLLARTAFYKVGHHGSVNATARTALEAMDPSRLVAFVPVDGRVARERCRWDDFPAAKLTARLHEQTSGRLIRADDAWLQNQEKPPFADRLGGALKSISNGLTAGTRVPWVELSFRV